MTQEGGDGLCIAEPSHAWSRQASSPTTCSIGRGVAFGLQLLLLRVQTPLEQQGREAKRRGLEGQGEPASYLRADRSS
jgi:hypothetical protein